MYYMFDHVKKIMNQLLYLALHSLIKLSFFLNNPCYRTWFKNIQGDNLMNLKSISMAVLAHEGIFGGASKLE